jgi:hypothetical protein
MVDPKKESVTLAAPMGPLLHCGLAHFRRWKCGSIKTGKFYGLLKK